VVRTPVTSAQSDWHRKVVRRFVSERFGVMLARSSGLTSLHRLGMPRPHSITHLLKAEEAKRAGCVDAMRRLLDHLRYQRR
jgi:hypothetical protein